MARTLMAHLPGLARIITIVPTGYFMHHPPWMAGTIFRCPKPVRAIEALLYANNFCDAGQVPILRYFEACNVHLVIPRAAIS